MRKVKVGIVGATGIVGKSVVDILQEEGLLSQVELFLFASKNSSKNNIKIKNKYVKIKALDDKILNLCLDVAIFSAGEEVSKNWAKKLAQNRTFVIDNSCAFRLEQGVPLVVPEINKNLITNSTKIISNPNCSTIELALIIKLLNDYSKIRKIVVNTYQSASGAGLQGIFDLKNSTNYAIKEGITNNIIPKIGEIQENGFSLEENKIMLELNKILSTKIEICATAVRVPIEYCHGESVFVEFENMVDVTYLKKSLNKDYIKFSDDEIFLPINCAGTNLTYVCRLRQVSEKEISFFVVADNVRRGASFNAVKILEHVISKFLTKNNKI